MTLIEVSRTPEQWAKISAQLLMTGQSVPIALARTIQRALTLNTTTLHIPSYEADFLIAAEALIQAVETTGARLFHFTQHELGYLAATVLSDEHDRAPDHPGHGVLANVRVASKTDGTPGFIALTTSEHRWIVGKIATESTGSAVGILTELRKYKDF